AGRNLPFEREHMFEFCKPMPARCGLGVAIFLAAMPALAEGLSVPSGQPVTPYEVLREEQQSGDIWLRFRFLAPEIGASYSFDQVADDFPYLCETYALPVVQNEAVAPAMVVISLSDREVAFGESGPEATQCFEAYT